MTRAERDVDADGRTRRRESRDGCEGDLEARGDRARARVRGTTVRSRVPFRAFLVLEKSSHFRLAVGRTFVRKTRTYRAEFRRVEGRYIRIEIQVHQSSDSVLSRRSMYPSLDFMKIVDCLVPPTALNAPSSLLRAPPQSAHTTARARTPASSFANPPAARRARPSATSTLAGRPRRELERDLRPRVAQDASASGRSSSSDSTRERGAMSAAPRPAAGIPRADEVRSTTPRARRFDPRLPSLRPTLALARLASRRARPRRRARWRLDAP